MDIHLKIKFIREKNYLTQLYMANKLKISQSTYNKLETGKSKICIKIFFQISQIFELSMDDIYNLKTDKYCFKKNTTSNKKINSISLLKHDLTFMILNKMNDNKNESI